MMSKTYIKCFKNLFYTSVKSYSTKNGPIISCKRKDFDFYGQKSNKTDDIKLASAGWNDKKSRGDYFIIHRQPNSSMKNVISTSTSFSDVGLEDDIVNAVLKQNIVNPTNIQSKSIPVLLLRKNALITAETGCGKTLAYLLPIIQQMKHLKNFERSYNSPLAVVLTPSRELAEQICNVAEELCKDLNLDVKSLVGGRTKNKMMNPSFQNVDLLVASFGAYSKLVTTGIYKLHEIRHVVLDEADSLLDDSFIDKVAVLMAKIKFHFHASESTGAQLTLVSATMPQDLPDIVSKFIDPDSIKKLTSDGLHKTMAHVPQRFLRLGLSQKPVELLKLIRADVNKKNPVMIFSNRSQTCDWISMFLNENGINCVNINGNMQYMIKAGKFHSYSSGEVDVLSCTDIASRGLDTIRTKHILNYDFPMYSSDYIHRCGRTGRLGSSPDSHVTNFVASPREIELVQKIEMSVRQMVDLPNVNANIRRIITNRIKKQLDAMEKLVATP